MKRVHWPDADRICSEIMAFAASATGDVRRVEGAPSNERVLRVGNYRVRLRLERISRTVVPLFIWRFR